MRDLPNKQIIAAMVITGLTVGGYRSWHSWHDGKALAGTGEGIAQIELIATPDKDNWVRSQVYLFNNENFKRYHITTKYMDSRAAMEAIIHGKEQPVIWSPDSPVWLTRASEVMPASTPLVDVNDATSFCVFLRTPVVILTTRAKESFLRPLLSGPRPWQAVHDLAVGKMRAPWGRLTYRHADPLTSNSGMLALGMMLSEYMQTHSAQMPAAAVAQSPAFADFLAETEKALSFNEACKDGSAAVARQFAADPASCDFIVTYENLALAAVKKNPDLVAIYPRPTMVAEEALSVLNGAWVSPNQKEGAMEFMRFVSSAKARRDGLKYDMRPATQDGTENLDPILTANRSNGFQSMIVQETTPPYDALNSAAVAWNSRVRR